MKMGFLTNWFEAMNLPEQIFACIAVVFTVLLIFQFILLLIGAASHAGDLDGHDFGHGHDMDMSHDVGHDFGDGGHDFGHAGHDFGGHGDVGHDFGHDIGHGDIGGVHGDVTDGAIHDGTSAFGAAAGTTINIMYRYQENCFVGYSVPSEAENLVEETATSGKDWQEIGALDFDCLNGFRVIRRQTTN